jgi:O-methyltransferase/8-demethyl-8-(2,3-dimethoxy-alpha-L-rhamnosyl)tetracenomycin-C 4'-O-methyltransferase
VHDNFNRLGLLDAGNVHFLEGWIEDTLPGWNVTELAFLRIDVDLYSATYDALHHLYPRLSKGGAVLFDDWKFPYSEEAIEDYRRKHSITTPVQFLPGCIDPMAYWIKE